MKKKEWYELLNIYNDQIRRKNVYQFGINEEILSDTKDKIRNYLTVTCEAKLQCDVIGLAMSYGKQGYNYNAAKNKVLNSWVGKWMERATHILDAVEKEEEIKENDIKDSFYGIRMLDGRLNLLQYLLLIVGLFMAAGFVVVVF